VKKKRINISLFLQRLYFIIFFLYIIAPIIIVMIIAFNDSKLPTLPLRSFTLRWFPVMIHNERLIKSLITSLWVGIGTTSLSLFLGITSAFAFVRRKFFGQNFFYFIAIAPIIIPGAILGTSILIALGTIGIEGGVFAAILGQTIFIASFVLLTVMSQLKKFDLSLEEAAVDLGASKIEAVRRVTIPFLKPAIISSTILAFLLSFDNFGTTVFLIGNEMTLPIYIYSTVRFGYTPEMNALFVCLVFVAVIGGIVQYQLYKLKAK